MFRYVDDLLVPCRSPAEGKRLLLCLREIAELAGLSLKPEAKGTRVVNLEGGDVVVWLGYRVTWDRGAPRVGIDPESFDLLQEELCLLHDEPNASLRAVQKIDGWLDYLGPCFESEDRAAVIEKIRRIGHESAFDELPSSAGMESRWREASQRWDALGRACKGKAESPAGDVASSSLPVLASDGPPF